MKAICLTPERSLEVRDIPAPERPAPGHVLIDVQASAVTHGDKFFLRAPLPGGAGRLRENEIYGANGGGRVIAVGEGVPAHYEDKQVTIYRGLRRTPDSTGLWCRRAQAHHASCLILPEDVSVRDYCGSLANIVTVYAFLADIVAGRHKALIVTAGGSATGKIAASLTKTGNTPAIFLARSDASRDALAREGVEHVLSTKDPEFLSKLQPLAEKLDATAVFDGVGGGVLTDIFPALPMNTEVHIYGFLGGAAPISLSAGLLLAKNLSLRRFANLTSPTVTEDARLAAALAAIGPIIETPNFKTKIGREFTLDQIDQAMAYSDDAGGRAIFV